MSSPLTPTPFGDLNAVLAELVAGVQDALGATLCGVYLQGSFALGDADEHSDVDFLVVTHEDVSGDRLEALQQLHGRLHAIEVPWAQHLEGSYIATGLLRDVDPARTKLPYLDNGASRLVFDDHCNTAVVRWTTREHGVVLAGPEPSTLIAPVGADQLRAEALAAVAAYVEWAPEPTRTGGMSRWKQAYLVITCCRLLHTIETGTVSSKKQAGEWALSALGGDWAELVQRALDERPDPWLRVSQATDPVLADRTLAFVAHTASVAAASSGRMLPRR